MVPSLRDSVSGGSAESGDEFPDRTFRSGSRRQKSTVLGPESGSFTGENENLGPESGSFTGENTIKYKNLKISRLKSIQNVSKVPLGIIFRDGSFGGGPGAQKRSRKIK